MFIVAAVQHVKIGDLSMHQSGFNLSGDAPGEDLMDVSDDQDHIPDGAEAGQLPIFSKAEERTLVRDSTASFAGKLVASQLA